jgi:WD40 repeat protein
MEDLENLKREINQLKQELAIERSKVEKLEEECDLLAEFNEQLQSEMTQLRGLKNIGSLEVQRTAVPDEEERIDLVIESFADQSHEYAKNRTSCLPNISGGKNPISTCIFVSSVGQDIVFCGGVDCCLRGFDLNTNSEILMKQLSAPILCLSSFSSFVGCGLMDGSHFLGIFDSRSLELSGEELRNHQKYVVGVAFSDSGDFFTTISHDKSVNIYRCEQNNYIKYYTLNFDHTPESVVFVNNSELVLGLRDVSHLIYLQCDTLSQEMVSMNENAWDKHSSFTPLALAVSPCREYLLVCTDKHIHIVFKVKTNQRFKMFAGHQCGNYGKPSVCWDSSGKFIYSNSEEENIIYVYNFVTQKIIKTLQSHTGFVRSVACHPSKPILSSVAYDKSLIIWSS